MVGCSFDFNSQSGASALVDAVWGCVVIGIERSINNVMMKGIWIGNREFAYTSGNGEIWARMFYARLMHTQGHIGVYAYTVPAVKANICRPDMERAP